MTVFLHYTQEELDHQFNQVSLAPHYEEYFAIDAKLSSAFRKTHPCLLLPTMFRLMKLS